LKQSGKWGHPGTEDDFKFTYEFKTKRTPAIPNNYFEQQTAEGAAKQF